MKVAKTILLDIDVWGWLDKKSNKAKNMSEFINFYFRKEMNTEKTDLLLTEPKLWNCECGSKDISEIIKYCPVCNRPSPFMQKKEKAVNNYLKEQLGE